MTDDKLERRGDPNWPSLADITRSLTPFLGRRLHALWRSPSRDGEVGDVWLEFCPRGDEPTLLRLTSNRGTFTSWYGSSSWCLRVEVATALTTQGLEPWFAFPLPKSGSLRDWSLTELWLSPVAVNIAAPQSYWVQEVCGGVALHCSNTTGPNLYGHLLGTTFEHHVEVDALHEVFCADLLPPLVGSGPWRRVAYIKDDTPLDDPDVRHFDDCGYRGPAVRACERRLNRALYDFEVWFDREPSFARLRSETTRRWYDHHQKLLSDQSDLFGWAESPRGWSGEALQKQAAAAGLGTLFSDAWYARDAADADAPRAKVSAPTLREIRRRYAPVRETYRQWFQLHRQACIAQQRLRNPRPQEPVPDWIWTLDAALTRGFLRFDELQACSTALVLRDDYREPWAPAEDLKALAQAVSPASSSPQDVLIEGDEERSGYLRITWWPRRCVRNQVIALRVDRAALQAWWSLRVGRTPVSSFERHLAWQAGRTPAAETWPAFADIVARAPKPPGVRLDALDLPPYSLDDVHWLACLRMQGEPAKRWSEIRAADPELVWTFDSSHRRMPLPIGRDVHPLMLIDPMQRARERVTFPVVWPPEVLGDSFKPFHLMWSSSHWREERIEGRDYRRTNWLLPVQRWVALGDDADGAHGWRWGLIDLDGCFVLPCHHPAMGFPQPRDVGRPVLPEQRPPLGRREPWCWIWVGEMDKADGLQPNRRHGAPGDVIEVWSGQLMNAEDQAVLRLEHQFMIVCVRADVPRLTGGPPVALGLANLTTGHCGPLRWQRIDSFSLSITHAAPARDAHSGEWTYIDDEGETLTPTAYARTEQVDGGLAIVQLSIVQAQAQNRVLTLPDGTRQGPVGVFGPNGAGSLGQWFVAPRWRDVLGEYDGHFVVQDTEGRWGMISPEGEPVTPFLARQSREDLNGDLLQQAMAQFKRLQKRRFLDWMRQARHQGSLAVMAGQLRSSFGKYDYGALPCREVAVRLTRDLAAAPPPYGSVPLLAGSELGWNPGQRSYYHAIDLRTHTMVGVRSEHGGGYHGISVPWDALALATCEPDDGSGATQNSLWQLNTVDHVVALDVLLAALDALTERLEADTSIVARDAEFVARMMASLCFSLALLLVVHGHSRGYTQAELAHLRSEFESLDLPSILTRGRYEKEGSERSRGRYGFDAPLWIGDDGESTAVATHHPWAQAMRAPLDQAVTAHQAWLPLFKAATAHEDDQGTKP